MKKIVSVLCLLYMCSLFCSAQTNQEIFEQMRKEMRQEFSDYQKDNEREYAKYLRQTWHDYQLEKGIPSFNHPKPDTITPVPSIRPQIETEKLEAIQATKQMERPALPEIRFDISKKEKGKYQITVPFYGSTFHFSHTLKPCRLRELQENEIASVWESFGEQETEALLSDLILVKIEMKLNDWAFFRLIEQTIAQLPQLQDANTRCIFKHYTLYKYGYDTKMGIMGQELVLLIPIQEKVYKYSFLTENYRKYYLFTENGKAVSGNIRTLPALKKNQQRPFSIALTKPILFADTPCEIKRSYQDLTISATINKNRIDFFKDMPQTELPIYTTTSVDPLFAEEVLNTIRTKTDEMDIQTALNYLLHFTQSAFKYQIDEKQFGYEKFFFPEETFYYPFSDCEDRAIFFSWLVRKLLKTEIVLLHYNDHIATAVNLGNDVPGLYIYSGGKRYLICDPTYTGANIGQCMPGYKDKIPKIVTIQTFE